jgi:hypothetical protein
MATTPMQNVFTGKTASITLAKSADPDLAVEAADADSIITKYFGTNSPAVGRATGVQVSVQAGLDEFHEIGARLTVVLQPGNISVMGSIDRAYISGALITLLLGRGAVDKLKEPFVQPAFNILVNLKDPAIAGTAAEAKDQAQLVLGGVKFENWNFTLPEDDFVLEKITFRALTLHIVDNVFDKAGGKPTPVTPFPAPKK